MQVRSLILVGGQSSRIGIPKHTLILPSSDGQPLLLHLIGCHHRCQLLHGKDSSDITIAVRDSHQRDETQKLLLSFDLSLVHIDYVEDEDRQSGPAAGLLAAYSHDQRSTWVVTGCDYPLLTASALAQLLQSHLAVTPAVTCFVNEKEFPEPLLAAWDPAALQLLQRTSRDAMSQGKKIGPMKVIHLLQDRQSQLGTAEGDGPNALLNCLKPDDYLYLTNVNTKADWDAVAASMTKESNQGVRHCH